jgi:hypothetical protein
MKLTALYDAEGTIIAGVLQPTGQYDRPVPVPVASDHTSTVGTFDVPASASKLSLTELCLSHRVDHTSKALMAR